MFLTLSAEDLPLNVPFDETIRIAKATGFGAVDLPMTELFAEASDPSADLVGEKLGAAGLRAGGWWLPVEFREDEGKYQAGLRLLPRAASLARALNSPWCVTWIWPYSDDLDFDSNMRLHVSRLSPVAAQLRDFGIQFGLEFVGPQTLRAGHKYEFISTLSQTLELIDKLGSDNLGVLLDCWQWYTSGGTVAELDALDGDQIVYAHINDAPVGRDVFAQIDEERMLPGVTGVIDIENFLKALNRHEFNGPVSVEPYNAELTALAPIERARRARSSAEAVFRKARIAIA